MMIAASTNSTYTKCIGPLAKWQYTRDDTELNQQKTKTEKTKQNKINKLNVFGRREAFHKKKNFCFAPFPFCASSRSRFGVCVSRFPS